MTFIQDIWFCARFGGKLYEPLTEEEINPGLYKLLTHGEAGEDETLSQTLLSVIN